MYHRYFIIFLCAFSISPCFAMNILVARQIIKIGNETVAFGSNHPQNLQILSQGMKDLYCNGADKEEKLNNKSYIKYAEDILLDNGIDQDLLGTFESPIKELLYIHANKISKFSIYLKELNITFAEFVSHYKDHKLFNIMIENLPELEILIKETAKLGYKYPLKRLEKLGESKFAILIKNGDKFNLLLDCLKMANSKKPLRVINSIEDKGLENIFEYKIWTLFELKIINNLENFETILLSILESNEKTLKKIKLIFKDLENGKKFIKLLEDLDYPVLDTLLYNYLSIEQIKSISNFDDFRSICVALWKMGYEDPLAEISKAPIDKFKNFHTYHSSVIALFKGLKALDYKPLETVLALSDKRFETFYNYHSSVLSLLGGLKDLGYEPLQTALAISDKRFETFYNYHSSILTLLRGLKDLGYAPLEIVSGLSDIRLESFYNYHSSILSVLRALKSVGIIDPLGLIKNQSEEKLELIRESHSNFENFVNCVRELNLDIINLINKIKTRDLKKIMKEKDKNIIAGDLLDLDFYQSIVPKKEDKNNNNFINNKPNNNIQNIVIEKPNNNIQDNNKEEVEIPEGYLDCITCEIMGDPVLCDSDGHSYDRKTIERIIKEKGVSPWTQNSIKDAKLIPLRDLKDAIDDFLAKHPEVLKKKK